MTVPHQKLMNDWFGRHNKNATQDVGILPQNIPWRFVEIPLLAHFTDDVYIVLAINCQYDDYQEYLRRRRNSARDVIQVPAVMNRIQKTAAWGMHLYCMNGYHSRDAGHEGEISAVGIRAARPMVALLRIIAFHSF